MATRHPSKMTMRSGEGHQRSSTWWERKSYHPHRHWREKHPTHTWDAQRTLRNTAAVQEVVKSDWGEADAKSRRLVRLQPYWNEPRRASASDGQSAWWRAINAVPITREKQLRPNVFKTERKKNGAWLKCAKSLQGFLLLNRIPPGWYQNYITQEATTGKNWLNKMHYMFVWQLKTGLKFQISF